MSTATISQDMDGDKLYQQRARETLPLLVRQAEAGKSIVYSELAAELGMPNPRNLNFVLGSVGQTLIEIGKEWGESIPPIQSLVVNKQRGLPGEGFLQFLTDTDRLISLPKKQQQAVIDGVHSEVFRYTKWRDVLRYLGLPHWSSSNISDLVYAATEFVSLGESEEHRRLKEFVSKHPAILGLPKYAGYGLKEYVLPSGDRVDVVFRHEDEWIAVEVKSIVSQMPDIVRGMFQCVKYRAVFQARAEVAGVLESVRVVLALEGELPHSLKSLQNVLGIEVIERVFEISIA